MIPTILMLACTPSPGAAGRAAARPLPRVDRPVAVETIEVNANQVRWSGDAIAVDDGKDVVVYTSELDRVARHRIARDGEGWSGFDLGGDRVFVFGDDRMRVLEWRSGKVVWERTSPVVGGAIADDGRSWIAPDGRGGAAVYSDQEARPGHGRASDNAWRVDLSDGWAWASDPDGTLLVWRADGTGEPTRVPLPELAWRVRDGGSGLLVVGLDRSVWVDRASGALTPTHVPGIAQAVFDLTPDGRVVVYRVGGGDTARIVAWDLAERRQVARIDARHGVWDLALSPDGRRVAWVGEGRLSVAAISGQGERAAVLLAGFADGGATAWWLREDGEVTAWDVGGDGAVWQAWSPLAPAPHQAPLVAVPDAAAVIGVSDGAHTRVDLRTGEGVAAEAPDPPRVRPMPGVVHTAEGGGRSVLAMSDGGVVVVEPDGRRRVRRGTKPDGISLHRRVAVGGDGAHAMLFGGDLPLVLVDLDDLSIRTLD